MNRFNCLLLTAYCLLVFSCGHKDKSVPIPANVLSKEKMARVLADVHIAEAEEKLHSPLDSTQKVPINFQKVFVKDTINKQQYEESLTFYIDHPELLNKVYEDVVSELSKMQGTPGKQ